MNLAKLLKKSFDAGFSLAKNKDIAPYFWAFVGSITIVSAVFPSLPLPSFLAQLGGLLFFVIMTSYLTRNEDAGWPGPSTKLLGRRSLEIIVTCLDVFITTAIAAAIYLIGLFLLIIPGIIAGKKLIYSPLIAATQNLNPIEALKESNKFARANGWSLLIGEFIIIILIIILLIAGAFLSTLSISSVATTVLSLILGLSVDWLACVVLPHMMVIAFKEATVKLNRQSA